MRHKILATGKITMEFSAAVSLKYNHTELYSRHPGGLVYSIIQALNQFSTPCTLISRVCSDTLGHMLIKDIKNSGIDVSTVSVSDGQTGVSILDASDHELFHIDYVYHSDSLNPKIPEEIISSAGLFFCNIDTLNIPGGKELLSRIFSVSKKQESLLIISSINQFGFEADIFSSADILCVDNVFFNAHSNPHNLFQNRTQAIFVFSDHWVSLITPTTVLKLSFDSIKGTPAYGISALLFFLAKAEIMPSSLRKLLSSSADTESLMRFIKNACCVHGIEELNFTSLYFKNNTNELLTFAQSEMDKSAAKTSQSKWYLKYHIAAPSGWINDPNGLIQLNGVYHVFFQLHPFSPEWGPMYWGHVTSKDLVHWKHEPIALAPDKSYEAGCFSGSAVNDNGILTLVYTAHNNIGNTITESQCIARSYDNGKTFVKSPKNPVIKTYPKDGSPDFRDPKVWKQDGSWYMVVGSGKHKKGRALLYSSSDLENWNYRGIMFESDGSQGTIWECPNFCTVDGRDIFIFSPMEMKNHKSVYCVGVFDPKTGKYTSEICRELDYGLNFYASQVFSDESGRVILIAWMDMWGVDFPSQADGWAGALTLPRVLHMRDNTLLQQPIPELASLRKSLLLKSRFTLSLSENPLRDLCGDCLEFSFMFKCNSEKSGFTLGMRVDPTTGKGAFLIYDGQKNSFAFPHILHRVKDKSQKEFIPCETASEIIDVHIYIDKSSIEIFIDQGALCFTQRIYPAENALFYNFSGNDLEVIDFKAWNLDSAF